MTELHKKSAAISIGRESPDPMELLIAGQGFMADGFRERCRRGQRGPHDAARSSPPALIPRNRLKIGWLRWNGGLPVTKIRSLAI